jgi:hypothetical protein
MSHRNCPKPALAKTPCSRTKAESKALEWQEQERQSDWRFPGLTEAVSGQPAKETYFDFSGAVKQGSNTSRF